jgi:hypothetical protein
MGQRSSLVATLLVLACLGCGPQDSVEPMPATGSPSSGYALDPGKVPEPLRHLVPLARRWGVGDDVERMELIERCGWS